MSLTFTRTLVECKISECNGKHKAYGLCQKHYLRLKKHGDPTYIVSNKGKRSEAKSLGLKRYFTGKPCPVGHIAERTVDRGACVMCARRFSDGWRSKSLDKVRIKDRKRYAANSGPKISRSRRRRANNPQYDREYAATYRKLYPTKKNAMGAKYRSAKLQRIPAWADLGAIQFFYECCPAGCHVDHIIPLQGKTVSGLHVENNLQWLPAAINCGKGNRIAPPHAVASSRAFTLARDR